MRSLLIVLALFSVTVFPKPPVKKDVDMGEEKRAELVKGLEKALKGAHPCTSSSEQGGGKRVLEAFF